MEKEQISATNPAEIKERLPLWLYPSTQKLVEQYYPADNYKSKSEFIEKAIRFYSSYLAAKDGTEFLAPVLVSVLRGMVLDTERHMTSTLFKQAVEISVLTNILAANVDITPNELRALRGQCINNVKKFNGHISFDTATRFKSEL